MLYPITPDRLLRQARALAGYDAGRGRPSYTNHRRAVSAAYYALFHAITDAAVHRILGDGVADDEDRFRARRWINHADIKAASHWVQACANESAPTSNPAGKTGSKYGVWELFSVPSGGGQRQQTVPSAVDIVTRAFIDLQDVRHAADYDHLAVFDKPATRLHVETSSRAVAALADKLEDPYMERFLALVIFRANRLRSGGAG